jgi:hypothetical protein
MLNRFEKYYRGTGGYPLGADAPRKKASIAYSNRGRGGEAPGKSKESYEPTLRS